MKRVLFAVFALFIMAGYMFAQNEAYVQQVSGLNNIAVLQTGSGNKLAGDGLAFGNAAAWQEGHINPSNLSVEQQGSSEIWLHQVTGINSNTVIGQYTGNTNYAHLYQVAGQYEGLFIYQYGNARINLEQTAGTTNWTDIWQLNGSTSAPNKVDLKTTASGSNTVMPGFFATSSIYGGIWQNGQGNEIHGTTPDAYGYAANDASKSAIQTATAGDNSFSVMQIGNTNLIGVSQISANGNTFDVSQAGDLNKMFIDQNGSANRAKVLQSGGQNLSVHQVGPGINTLVVSM